MLKGALAESLEVQVDKTEMLGTYLNLSFFSESPVLLVVTFFASCHFNVGAICFGVYVQAGSVPVVCRGLLVLDQEVFFEVKRKRE